MITISGKITDKETGEALPQANVYFSDRQGQILSDHQGSAADNNGNYTIEGNGAYITASYVGYTKETKPFKRSVDFKLKSGVNLKEVEVLATIDKKPRISKETVIVAGAVTGFAAIFGLLFYTNRIS